MLRIAAQTGYDRSKRLVLVKSPAFLAPTLKFFYYRSPKYRKYVITKGGARLFEHARLFERIRYMKIIWKIPMTTRNSWIMNLLRFLHIFFGSTLVTKIWNLDGMFQMRQFQALRNPLWYYRIFIRASGVLCDGAVRPETQKIPGNAPLITSKCV